MDKITTSLLEEFSAQFDLARLKESEQFEAFACYAILKRYHSAMFAPSDFITSTATGIDGIAIIANGTLLSTLEDFDELDEVSGELDVHFFFLQAKRSSSFDAAALSSFGLAVADFFLDEPKFPSNPELTEPRAIMQAIYRKAAKFRGNPDCHLYYVTTGKTTTDALLETRRQHVLADLKGTHNFGIVECVLLGASELQDLYRQASKAISREFKFLNRTVVPEVPGVTEAYLGFVPATELLKLLQGDDGQMLTSIFYANVRDWEGYNDINQAIRETLKSPSPSRFVLMNNGVTITARKVRPTANSFHIEDYQIVNGCQTSNVLYDQRDLLSESILVPLRLIATDDDELINSITKATNRQTPVRPEQFWALTEFPKLIEAFFQAHKEPQRLYYERRNAQWDRHPIEKVRVVTQTMLTRAFAAMFLEEPHITTRSKKSLNAKLGTEIGAKEHRLEPYYVAAFTQYKLEYLFRNRKLEAKYKPARFHIMLATRLLANPAPKPPMNSNDMEKYCEVVTRKLWDAGESEELLLGAVAAVDEIAKGNFQRDNIRTLAFTKALQEYCKRANS